MNEELYDHYENDELDDFFLDPELQAQIRADFIENQSNAVAEIRAFLANGENTRAEIVVHNLKSVAALMTETTLADAALDIELQLKNGGTPQDAAIENLNTLINHVLQKGAPPR
ncbi:MAG: hypothetical protein FWC16_09005 [Defluviitaleaceae bacterium]|nr:hypothetical protein [Defluviitaleaceae bacterium]MCL2275048.1 hypothetical protein [Defluviitaleaceae bacterium]